MAKIKRRKLRWEASESSQVVAYKLYWAEGGGVNYNSDFEMIGNKTEIILPDDLKTFPVVQKAVEFGVTAVNEVGNESDMIKLYASFQFSVPDAPKHLEIEKASGDHIYEESVEHMDQFKSKITPLATDDDNYDSYNLLNKIK